MPKTYSIAATIFFIASAMLNGPPAAAESVTDQCRAAVRAELKGPGCRVANTNSRVPRWDPCGFISDADQIAFVDKVRSALRVADRHAQKNSSICATHHDDVAGHLTALAPPEIFGVEREVR